MLKLLLLSCSPVVMRWLNDLLLLRNLLRWWLVYSQFLSSIPGWILLLSTNLDLLLSYEHLFLFLVFLLLLSHELIIFCLLPCPFFFSYLLFLLSLSLFLLSLNYLQLLIILFVVILILLDGPLLNLGVVLFNIFVSKILKYTLASSINDSSPDRFKGVSIDLDVLQILVDSDHVW